MKKILVLLFVSMLITSCNQDEGRDIPISYYLPKNIVSRASFDIETGNVNREAIRYLFYETSEFIKKNPPSNWKEFDSYIHRFIFKARDFYISDTHPVSASEKDIEIFLTVIKEYKIYCRKVNIPNYMIDDGYVFIGKQLSKTIVHK